MRHTDQMIIACKQGEVNTVQSLLMDAPPLDVEIGLNIAAQYNHAEVVLLLLPHANTELDIALRWAIRNKNDALQKHLLPHVDVFKKIEDDYVTFCYMALFWSLGDLNDYCSKHEVPQEAWSLTLILAAHLPYSGNSDNIKNAIKKVSAETIKEVIEMCFETRNNEVLDILCEYNDNNLSVCWHYLRQGYFQSEKSRELFKKIIVDDFVYKDIKKLFKEVINRADLEYIQLLMPHCKEMVSELVSDFNFIQDESENIVLKSTYEKISFYYLFDDINPADLGANAYSYYKQIQAEKAQQFNNKLLNCLPKKDSKEQRKM